MPVGASRVRYNLCRGQERRWDVLGTEHPCLRGLPLCVQFDKNVPQGARSHVRMCGVTKKVYRGGQRRRASAGASCPAGAPRGSVHYAPAAALPRQVQETLFLSLIVRCPVSGQCHISGTRKGRCCSSSHVAQVPLDRETVQLLLPPPQAL